MNANENMICQECGCADEQLFELEINGETKLVCADCARDLGFVRCDDCGEWVPEDESYVTADGETICESCYEDNYFTCEDCGEIHHNEDLIVVNPGRGDEQYVCSDCAERHYYRCDDCGEYFYDCNVHIGNNDVAICDDCWDRGGWSVCEDCGDIVSDDEINYCESDGCYYCDSCYADHNESCDFHDYYYKPTPEFKFRSSEARNHENILTFGVELEVDLGDDHQDLTRDLAALEQPIYMKHDGSLGSEGVEIVTHPCSLAYHTYKLRWAEISRTCRNHDFKSHNTDSCGLHIHVGRRQFGDTPDQRSKTAGNLVILARQLWDSLTIFSRREKDRLDRWAARPNLDMIQGASYTDSDLTQMALNTERDGRYQAVNLCNRETVEFRLFRGTLKRSTILASLQLVDAMTHFAMDHTPTECFNATFADVIGATQFKELHEYCISRGLL